MSLCLFLFCGCPLSHSDLITWETEREHFLSLLPFHLFISVSHLKSLFWSGRVLNLSSSFFNRKFGVSGERVWIFFFWIVSGSLGLKLRSWLWLVLLSSILVMYSCSFELILSFASELEFVLWCLVQCFLSALVNLFTFSNFILFKLFLNNFDLYLCFCFHQKMSAWSFHWKWGWGVNLLLWFDLTLWCGC